MPINIREILYPGDSDQIKWDKINYNFDQIVTNGGKTGPSGTKGDVGPTGITGNTGDKGDKGEQGLKGEIGNTTNFWDQLNHGNTDTFVLKPVDGSTGKETALFIGDTSYESGLNDGDLSQSAQLVVKNSPGFSYAQAFLPADDSATTPGAGEDALTISGNYSSDWDSLSGGPGTVWNITPEYSPSNVNRRLNISADMLDLSADLLNISGGVSGIKVNSTSPAGLEITANTDITGDTNIDGTFDVTGDTTLQTLIVQGNDSSFTGTGSILLPKGTTANRPSTPNAGMIRFNTQSQKFEGYGSAGSWLDFNRLSNANKNTYVAVETDADYPFALANQVRFIAGGDVIANMSNAGFYIDKDVYINNTSSGSNDIYFRGPASGIVYPAGALKISGIGSLPAGTVSYSSPSNGSAESLRKLNDYFYQESYFPEASNLSGSNHDGTYFIGLWGSTNSAVYWQDPINSGGNDYYQKSTESKVTWTKIGHQVMVNGYYRMPYFGTNGSVMYDWRSDVNAGFDRVLLGLGEITGTSASGVLAGTKSQFPFINKTDQPILVNVKIYGANYNSGTNNDKYLSNCFGLIQPGERFIKLWYTTDSNGTENSYVEAVKGDDLSAINADAVTILFNFTMPVDINTGQNTYTTGTGTGTGTSTGFLPQDNAGRL